MEPTTTTYGGGGGVGDSPPLWPPSTTSSRRRNPPSPFSTPVFVFVILPIIFYLLTLFLVPTFFSRNSQITKPSTTINTTKAGGSVKKIWDLFNLFLVLFALLCGIFAKKTPNDDDDTSSTSTATISSTSGGAASDDVRNVNLMKSGGGVLSSNHWFDGVGDDDNNQIRNHHHRFFSDTRIPERSFSMRNGGSVYSDRRHDPLPPPMNGIIGNGGDEGFKVFDDFDINRYRTLEMNNHDNGNDNAVSVHHRRRSMGELPVFKPVPVDKFVIPAPTEEPVEAPPPSDEPVLVAETVPPPLVPPVRRPRKTNNQSVSRRVEVHKRARSPPPPVTSSPPPASPLPPSPPPEMVTVPSLVEEDVKVEKKKKTGTIATKEIKTVLASIYNPLKRKKKHKTKIVIEDSLRDEPDLPVDSSPPSMQPPPPSVFKLFKKSNKNKKIHSVPPPVPPTRSSLNLQNATSFPLLAQPQPQPQQRASVSQLKTYSTTTGRPPLPNKSNNSFNNNVDNESMSTNSGGQSPLLPMPPPPLPPFQISAMKFTVKDDYIPIKGGPRTRSSSPELDSSSSASSNVMDNLDVNVQQSSVSCPSPDVNMKAETFIARLRDEWKNDKINSLKEKQKLGRIPSSNSIN